MSEYRPMADNPKACDADYYPANYSLGLDYLANSDTVNPDHQDTGSSDIKQTTNGCQGTAILALIVIVILLILGARMVMGL